MSAWTCRQSTARPPNRSFRLVLEPHDGRALVPIPKRSTSPWATSTLERWMVLKALDPERPIREADIAAVLFDYLVGARELRHGYVYKEMNVIASQNKKCCNATIE